MWRHSPHPRLLPALVAFICINSQLSCDKPPPAKVTYQSQDGSYKVSYPADWTRQADPPNEAEGIEAVLMTGDNPKSKLPSQIMLMKGDLPFWAKWVVPDGSPDVMEGVRNGLINSLKKTTPDLKVLEMTDVLLGGAAGERIVLEGTNVNSGPLKAVVTFTMRDKAIYVIAGRSTPQFYANLREDFDDVAASFQFVDTAAPATRISQQ